MARKFVSTWYRTDDGEGYRMRVRSDWSAVWTGLAADKPATINQAHVKVSKSNREYGIRPRYAVLSKTDVGGTGDSAVTNVRYLKIPVQTKSASNILVVGDEYTGGSPAEAWKLERIESEKLS